MKTDWNKNEKVSLIDKFKGYILPTDLNSEKDVLWYVMNGDHETVFEFIKDSDLFYEKIHSDVYKGVLKCIEKELIPNPLNILRNGGLEAKEVSSYASEIKKRQQPLNDIYSACMRVIEMEVSRKVVFKCAESMERVYENSTSSLEVADSLSSFGEDINESLNYISNYDFQDLKKEVIAEIKERVLNNSKVVKTSIPELDEVLGGFELGTSTIVAARPAMGKTALTVQLMYNIAIIQNKKIVMFNLEMTKQELCKRFIALHTKMSNFEIKMGLNQDLAKFEKMERMLETLTTNNIILIDNLYDANQIFSKCKQLVKNKGVEFMMFDYLQLASMKNAGNREQEISKISRLAKMTAKQCMIPTLSLSQLSRSVETRGGDKRPMLSDLRESGAIEQDADNVLFLYRPEYYDINEDEKGESTKDQLEIIIAKARNGVLRSVKLLYRKEYNEVSNWYDRTPKFGVMQGSIEGFESEIKTIDIKDVNF